MTPHLNDGDLRAALDQPLPEDAATHLRACPSCQARAVQIHRRAARIQTRLNLLAVPPQLEPTSARAALQTLHHRAAHSSPKQELYTMLSKFLNLFHRPQWAAAALILLLALIFSIPQVRALAIDFLGLFRVQQIALVPVNLEDLPPGSQQSLQAMQAVLAEDLQLTRNGETLQTEDLSTALAALNFTPRLPQNITHPVRYHIYHGFDATFTAQATKMQAILDEMGRADLRLPEGLEGARIEINVPQVFNVVWGECAIPKETPSPNAQPLHTSIECTTFSQMAAPTISAPPGLDLDTLGSIYLQLLGLNAQEAAAFSAKIDWATTLVLPIPTDTIHQNVQIGTASGIFVQKDSFYELLWTDNGMVYNLNGFGNLQTALEIAQNLK